MSKLNAPLIAFNRGLIDPESTARVDLDRARMSAEIMENWLPKTQGAMRIRPGTKHLGSSYNDTGAEFIEFVASTTSTALLELTDSRMRIWENDALLSRPAVGTTVSLTDTGWVDTSTGGIGVSASENLVPILDSDTGGAVVVSASSFAGDTGDDPSNPSADTGYIINGKNIGTTAGSYATTHRGLRAHLLFDRIWRDSQVPGGGRSSWTDQYFSDTGGAPSLPKTSWVNVDFGLGNEKAVTAYSVRAANRAITLDNVPRIWRMLAGDHDTGTFATDTGKWRNMGDVDSADWAVSEKRTFTVNDTGTAPDSYRHWRMYITHSDTGRSGIGGGSSVQKYFSEMELFAGASTQAEFQSGVLTLNATATGSLAKASRRVLVDTGDLNTEHSLKIDVERGPVTLRVGSSDGGDDYISEASLGTGQHNLSFTPDADFYITLQTDAQVNRIVSSLTVGDSGIVELSTPWTNDALDTIRYDQSADVVYVDSVKKPKQIERRGAGRSWSVVDYDFIKGPFRAQRSSRAELAVAQTFGNTTMTADIPFFRSGHLGALFQLSHDGQNGTWYLGAGGAATDAIEMTGIRDTGVLNEDTGVAKHHERQIRFDLSGAYTGKLTIQKSLNGPNDGFHDTEFLDTGRNDTGTGRIWVTDHDDNVTVWYRAVIPEDSYDTGAVLVNAYYANGSKTGIARVTDVLDNQTVSVEVLERFSDTVRTSSWAESNWSTERGFPSSVAFHDGRLFHAGGARLYGSAPDDFNNFDPDIEGESQPLNKTLGAGPVDTVFYLASLIRLVVGTAGAELAVRATSIDESLTQANSSVKDFSTQGSADLRSVKVDSRAFYVQRSGSRLFSIGFGQDIQAVGDFESQELTLLVPKLLKAGVRSIAVQRQPDTRIHCVLNDGRVAILTYEPQEEVLAWSTWVSDTGVNSQVERAMVLPGTDEDQVYYHVQRTINGEKKRFLEKWATETESTGDTGLSFIADCSASWTDTGATGTAFGHLIGAQVVAWGDDTGQTHTGRDLTPDDTGGTQQLLTVDTGGGIAVSGSSKGVGGLPYDAKFMSAKMAYGAEAGTALTQYKRIGALGLILSQTHNNGLFVGGDTGNPGATLDPLPRMNKDDTGAVDPDRIYTEYDEMSFPINGEHDTDSRLYLKGKAPRPVTVLAAVPEVETNDKI